MKNAKLHKCAYSEMPRLRNGSSYGVIPIEEAVSVSPHCATRRLLCGSRWTLDNQNLVTF